MPAFFNGLTENEKAPRKTGGAFSLKLVEADQLVLIEAVAQGSTP
ncbi:MULTISPECIES: hypothetical protein [Agrobacterium]|jgi:hypothetical protein|nr:MULTISPECIES: hypothetical protein [Agrobacterium]